MIATEICNDFDSGFNALTPNAKNEGGGESLMPRKPVNPNPSVAPTDPADNVAPVIPDEKEAQRVENRFIEIRSQYGSDTELRLRALYAIWRNPLGPKSLKASEEKELIRFGLVKNEIAEAGDIGNATACAEFIRKVFHYPCSKDDISKWGKGQRLPVGAQPFPMKDGGGSYKAMEIEAWCKASLPDVNGMKMNGIIKKDPRQRKEEADARMAERQDLREEREFSDEWCKTAGVKSFALGISAIVAGMLDKFVEDKDGVRKIVREVYLKCGATEEMVARADALLAPELVAANDGLKSQAGLEGERAMKRFEQQRKDEMKEKNL